MRAEFEEKQYEMQACIELASGRAMGRVFSSGQVLEKVLGYDAVADPRGDHIIWTILRAPRPPGVVLLPRFWLPGSAPEREALPASTISLMLQFKRPERMVRSGTAQWDLWGQPYFRFQRSEQQHQVLRRLEGSLAGSAVVRYAAPSFHTRGELDAAQMRGSVLRMSGFVSPSTLGAHRVWTYQEPGTVGRGNPGGPVVAFESLRDLTAQLEPPVQASGSSLVGMSWLPEMGVAVLRRNPRIRRPLDQWLAALEREDVELRADQWLDLRAYVAVQSEVARVGAHWWVVAGDGDGDSS